MILTTDCLLRLWTPVFGPECGVVDGTATYCGWG